MSNVTQTQRDEVDWPTNSALVCSVYSNEPLGTPFTGLTSVTSSRRSFDSESENSV
jgi:hypothetical protein